MILLIVILIMGSTRQLLMETGRNPGKKELLAVGLEAGMKKR